MRYPLVIIRDNVALFREIQLELIREIQKCFQLMNKKERLKHFFRDAIEEKRRFNLNLKSEDEFEDRVNEIYRSANERIKKLQKSMTQREQQDRDRLIGNRMFSITNNRTILLNKRTVHCIGNLLLFE